MYEVKQKKVHTVYSITAEVVQKTEDRIDTVTYEFPYEDLEVLQGISNDFNIIINDENERNGLYIEGSYISAELIKDDSFPDDYEYFKLSPQYYIRGDELHIMEVDHGDKKEMHSWNVIMSTSQMDKFIRTVRNITPST